MDKILKILERYRNTKTKFLAAAKLNNYEKMNSLSQEFLDIINEFSTHFYYEVRHHNLEHLLSALSTDSDKIERSKTTLDLQGFAVNVEEAEKRMYQIVKHYCVETVPEIPRPEMTNSLRKSEQVWKKWVDIHKKDNAPTIRDIRELIKKLE